MNAPVKAVDLIKPTLQLVAIEDLVPSRSHVQEVRRARFTKEEIQSLADDFKVNGMLQQPLVRPLSGEGVKALGKLGRNIFQIVAGERRWLAAKVAGMAEIYVNVRELTDEQALVAQLSENLKRKELHHLEEAEGYEEWMKTAGIKPEQIAESINQSRSYVYGRLKLLALCPEARKAFYAGEIDSSKALLIARIGHHDTQRQALQVLVKGTQHEGPPATYREAHKFIVENFMLKLKSAPFDTKDASLVAKAGSCDRCPKRTGNHPDLFGDIKDADICSDPKCFDDKRQAHFAIARRKLETAGRTVIHGSDAKKLMPHWEHNDNGYIKDTYVRLDSSEYVGGRYQKISDVLGKDYVPTLIQHPLTGKFIEVAPRSTVATKAAAKVKQRTTSSPAPRKQPAATSQRPDEPDYAELTAQRVGERLAQKVSLDRRALLLIADVESDAWGTVPDWLCKAVGVSSSGRLQLSKLSEKDLGRFIVLGTLYNGLAGDGGMTESNFAKDVCKQHKIDPKKVEAEIRAEFKKKVDADRLAINLRSKKPTWSGKVLPATSSKNFMDPLLPSDQLAELIGAAPIQRTEITKKIWGHIKKNGLQDKKNKRLINSDEKLLPIFGGKKQVSMFEMTKLVGKHLRVTSSGKAKAKASAKKKPAVQKGKGKKK